jgi:hypothetical protein
MKTTPGTLRSRGTVILMLAMVLPAVACEKGRKDPRAQRKATVHASMAEFDPEADIVLDLSKYGTERVDEWALQESFNTSFSALDQCVIEAKERHKMSPDKKLEGTLQVAVKLNPRGEPFGVNASISEAKWNQDEALKGCIKQAVHGVDYPKWDGPPQVAEFDVGDLDPGWEYE